MRSTRLSDANSQYGASGCERRNKKVERRSRGLPRSACARLVLRSLILRPVFPAFLRRSARLLSAPRIFAFALEDFASFAMPCPMHDPARSSHVHSSPPIALIRSGANYANTSQSGNQSVSLRRLRATFQHRRRTKEHARECMAAKQSGSGDTRAAGAQQREEGEDRDWVSTP